MDKSNPMLSGSTTTTEQDNSRKNIISGPLSQPYIKPEGKILKRKDENKRSVELIMNPVEMKSPNKSQQIDYGYYYNGVNKYYKSNEKEYFANLYKDHFKHTYISLQFCKNLKPPSKKDLILKRCT